MIRIQMVLLNHQWPIRRDWSHSIKPLRGVSFSHIAYLNTLPSLGIRSILPYPNLRITMVSIWVVSPYPWPSWMPWVADCKPLNLMFIIITSLMATNPLLNCSLWPKVATLMARPSSDIWIWLWAIMILKLSIRTTTLMEASSKMGSHHFWMPKI